VRVVCFVGGIGAPFAHFVNSIHESYSIDLIVLERRTFGDRLIRKIKSGPFKFLLLHIPRFLKDKLSSRKVEEICNQQFGDSWKRFPDDVPILRVDNINSPKVVAKLEGLKPDIILDHGTSIIKKNVLSLASYAFNLHWGLSPYYRGTHCTEWALIHWDPNNVGVTIHALSDAIDGGDIVGQERILISSQDSVFSINMRLTVAGTKIIKRIIGMLNTGQKPEFVKQDLSIGLLTGMRQWSSELDAHVLQLTRKNNFQRLIKMPIVRKKHKIIEFK